jgi:hypothetical protein
VKQAEYSLIYIFPCSDQVKQFDFEVKFRARLLAIRHSGEIFVVDEFFLFFLNDGEAFAGGALEPIVVDDLDFAAPVADDALRLHRLGDHPDAGALNAEHLREEFLRQGQMLVARALAHHGQPAAQARFDGVKMIADAGLRDLFDDDVKVLENDVVKRAALIEKFENMLGFDPRALGFDLNHRLVRHFGLSEQNRQTDHSFKAGEADFDRLPLFGNGKQGHHPAVRKIRVANRISGLKKNSAGRVADRFEMWL